MRLLNATTLEFKWFSDEALPPYVILSHTWGNEEINYQEQKYLQTIANLPDHLRENELYTAALAAVAGIDHSMMDSGLMRARAGFQKLERTAHLTLIRGLKWFWIDTCCINKSSSAELQEAINSMYRWYQQSECCIVYLEDAKDTSHSRSKQVTFKRMLAGSRWITRGWTLQELIAPPVVLFYDSSWHFVITKQSSLGTIRAVTGIPEYVLATGDLSRSSVAQKMAWSANRTTNRIEDLAYSLLGIFQVHMPMLYGERENAFMRLQEEIMRTTRDDSIFAWTASEGSLSTYRGLLARSPREFGNSHLMTQGNGTFATSNMGLRVELVLKPVMDEIGDDNVYLGLLNGLWNGRSIVAIVLRELEANKFARVCAQRLENVGDPKLENFNSIEDYTIPGDESPTAIYVEHKLRIPSLFQSRAIHAFCFKRGLFPEHAIPSYHVWAMRPTELALYGPAVMLIPRNADQHQHNFRVSPNEAIFLACVGLRINHRDEFSLGRSRMLMCGYNLSTGQAWCRVLGNDNWPAIGDSSEQWQFALGSHPVSQGGDIEALMSTDVAEERIKVNIVPGLYQDKICLLVHIDGLS